MCVVSIDFGGHPFRHQSEAVPFESVPLMSLPNGIRERERVYADAAA
jgi:hypothetical protein